MTTLSLAYSRLTLVMRMGKQHCTYQCTTILKTKKTGSMMMMMMMNENEIMHTLYFLSTIQFSKKVCFTHSLDHPSDFFAFFSSTGAV